MCANYGRVVAKGFKAKIEQLKVDNPILWANMKADIKAEYQLEDIERVTRRSFLSWVAKTDKGFGICELMREFEKRFDQLSINEQRSLDMEETDLFLQSVEPSLQQELEM